MVVKPWYRKRRASTAGLLARLFIDRLDRGVMIDRAQETSRGKPHMTVPAPNVLVTKRLSGAVEPDQ
jgi:hypothetical protein